MKNTINNNYDFIIIGAGIVGLATAYKLQLRHPKKSIAILEKENAIGMHQTGRNSGVIHSGIYYKPNSYKAKNCKEGREQLVAFVKENDVPHKICGKIIVATTALEITGLENIYHRGIKNNTPDIGYLNPDEIKRIEPYVNGLKAILVPTAGIIDYICLSKKFAELISKINKKSRLIVSCEFKHVKEHEIETSLGNFYAKKIIFCTGLHSDRTAKRDAIKTNMQIVGFRGDYYELEDKANHKINNLVYPVPDPKFPFLGVHFTPMIDGSIECGPNAVFSFKREGYSTRSFNLKDTLQALTYSGTWKLFSRHWRKGIDEYKRAFSKRLFVKELQKMIPSISMDDVKPVRSGVRAQAIDNNGNLIDDFKIEEKNGHIHVLNAPSPAATSCMAIADEIVNRVENLKY